MDKSDNQEHLVQNQQTVWHVGSLFGKCPFYCPDHQAEVYNILALWTVVWMIAKTRISSHKSGHRRLRRPNLETCYKGYQPTTVDQAQGSHFYWKSTRKAKEETEWNCQGWEGTYQRWDIDLSEYHGIFLVSQIGAKIGRTLYHSRDKRTEYLSSPSWWTYTANCDPSKPSQEISWENTPPTRKLKPL